MHIPPRNEPKHALKVREKGGDVGEKISESRMQGMRYSLQTRKNWQNSKATHISGEHKVACLIGKRYVVYRNRFTPLQGRVPRVITGESVSIMNDSVDYKHYIWCISSAVCHKNWRTKNESKKYPEMCPYFPRRETQVQRRRRGMIPSELCARLRL